MSWHTVLEEYSGDSGSYSGPAERARFELWGPPEQLAPVSIVTEIFSWIISHLPNYNGKPLYVKIDADWAPTMYTKYRIEIIAYPATTSAMYADSAKPQFVISIPILVAALLSSLLVGWQLKGTVSQVMGGWNISGDGGVDPGFSSDFSIEEFLNKYGIWIGVGVAAIVVGPTLLRSIMPKR